MTQNKHGTKKIIDMFEMYQCPPAMRRGTNHYVALEIDN
jgi:hypothetical protein